MTGKDVQKLKTEDKDQFKAATGPYYKVYDRVAVHANEHYKTLVGAILTTLEAVVDDERKLRALRTRVKNLQGLAWEQMLMALFAQAEWASTAPGTASDNLEFDMSKIVTEHELNYTGRLKNLVSAVLSDERRIDALNKELGNLIGTVGGYIRRNVHGSIETCFKK